MITRADLATIWLLGDPVAHSLSPLIQNAALAQLGEKTVYLAARVGADDFRRVVDALPRLGAIGANVTVPHKLLALECCDQLTDRARAIGAVNTLIFRNGMTVGDNTDGVGWWRSLAGVVQGRRFSRALVIGAGGASRAVCHTLISQAVDELVLFNRTREKAEELASALGDGGRSTAPTCRALSEFPHHLTEDCLIVQTTSVGLQGEGSPVELPSALPDGAVLSELIYGRVTPLMQSFRDLGGQAVDGLGMLVGQGAESLAMWLGRPMNEIPFDTMLTAARERLAEKGRR